MSAANSTVNNQPLPAGLIKPQGDVMILSTHVEFAQWAVVELMGHVTMACLLSEEERFGSKMARLEIPQPDGSNSTHYFTATSVYRITICTEEAARRVAERSWPRPPTPYNPPQSFSLQPAGIMNSVTGQIHLNDEKDDDEDLDDEDLDDEEDDDEDLDELDDDFDGDEDLDDDDDEDDRHC